jgi:hypothetical protein
LTSLFIDEQVPLSGSREAARARLREWLGEAPAEPEDALVGPHSQPGDTPEEREAALRAVWGRTPEAIAEAEAMDRTLGLGSSG